MLKGQIKSYSDKNAFGFIEQASGDDLFFFKTAVVSSGDIVPGQVVQYVVVTGQKGPQAAKVEFVD